MASINVPASKLPNVLQSVEAGEPQDIAGLRAAVTPMLLAFIDVVAPTYPHYTFYIRQGSVLHPARGVRVLLNAETIGNVEVPQPVATGVSKYALSTVRIRKARRTGDRTIKTMKLATAVKAFKLHFRPQSALEMVGEEVQGVQAVMREATGVRNTFKQAFAPVCFAVSDVLMAQWDTLSAAAIARGYPPGLLTGVVAKYQEYRVTTELQNIHGRGEGQYVVIKDGTYYTSGIGLREVQTFRSETLPTHVRTKVGMLKLVPDKTFVVDIGVRSSDKVFYVVPEVV